MTQASFYWHDYETWGADPFIDRPSQFAGIRTDGDLNIIGEPLMLYCKPPVDVLPQPEACLITAITPQKALQQGVSEAEFIKRVLAELAAPATCGVGYNSIRFDDEITRFSCFRNFYDAYAREWQNGNSRWDIIDVVRLCYALRPEGINWPMDASGLPSFRLEELSRANQLEHQQAHDALSDVYATIALAKLLKQQQPKLFDYAFGLRRKQAVFDLLDLRQRKPILHVSAMFSASRCCTALVMPLCFLPDNNNGIVSFDLSCSPGDLIELDVAILRQRLFSTRDELEAQGLERLPLKTIHANKSPMLVTPGILDEAAKERLQLDMNACEQHYQQLKAACEQSTFIEKLQQIFKRDEQEPGEVDVDSSLYQGGFFSDHDKQLMAQVRNSSAYELAENSFPFEDARLDELLFRYRGRNYPQGLNEQEVQRWQHFIMQRLQQGCGRQSLTLEQYQQRLMELAQLYQVDTDKMAILKALADWPGQLGLA